MKPDLTFNFEKNWSSYALAGGAMLISPMAKADLIVHTETISLYTDSATIDAGFLDVNRDSIDDYKFSVSSASDGTRYAKVEGLNGNLVFVDPFDIYYCCGPFVSTVAALGSAPDPSSVLTASGYFSKDKSPTKIKGNWSADSIDDFQYMGLQFTVGSDTYMGWAHVSTEFGSAALKVDESAYAVPEPSSMALMLLGAAGVAALKRRRRTAQ